MIIVKVELHSAITGKVTELGRMVIANLGNSKNPSRGNYIFATLRGRCREALELAQYRWLHDRSGTTKDGQLMQHKRKQEHVWNLVAKALVKMGYGDMNGAW